MAENPTEQHHLGNKTGENIDEGVLTTDAETGEPEMKETPPRKFQVPRIYFQQHQENVSRKSNPRRKTINGFYWRKQEIRSNVVKEFVLCKKQNVSPIVFILPTFLICPAWASILCLLGEMCMHIWSHKRNWKKKNSNVEYRSPFHVISSHFCVHCRSQKWMEKISRIQDKRTFKRQILYQKLRSDAIQ